MRTPTGFLLPMKNPNNAFEKPPFSIAAQLERLSSRGVIIQDKDTARHYLSYISYYRFCGYAIEFEDELINGEKQYRKGTTFEQILDCYVFDRKLRLLVIDAIERIEIAIRTVIINELALKCNDAHWYLDKSLFLPKFKHDDLIQSIKKETQYKVPDGSVQDKKRERFIKHYYEKYQIPELPAVWMVAEVLSLGSWSMIFANLVDRQNQKLICKHFGINYKVMTSWLHALTYLRNLCAHHSKLWNRNFTLKPVIANSYKQQLKNNSSFSAQAAILKIFLNVISPGSDWAKHLRELISDHPNIDVNRMGFRNDWQSDAFWH
ncbi:MAG: Abi family protein [Gammaproteobacteria bacterium]